MSSQSIENRELTAADILADLRDVPAISLSALPADIEAHGEAAVWVYTQELFCRNPAPDEPPPALASLVIQRLRIAALE